MEEADNRIWNSILQVKKDLAHDVRYLWIAVIVLIIGVVTLTASTVKSFNNVIEDMSRVREGFAILGLHDAPPADAPGAEVVAVNPAPVETPDPLDANWAEMAGCDVEAVAFRIDAGTITEDWQKEWEAFGDSWEIWAVALSKDADPSKYRTDIWGNPYRYQVSGETIPFAKLTSMHTIVYGKDALRIGDNDYWNGGAVKMDYPWHCKAPTIVADDIEWSNTGDMYYLGEFTGSRGAGNSFVTRFLKGRQMETAELQALVVAAETDREQDLYTFWSGSGFIGAGTSSGNFSIGEDGKLTWGFYWQGPEVDLGLQIPENTEIVTVTKQRWGFSDKVDVKIQRFVWTKVPGEGYRMLEQNNPEVGGSERILNILELK